VAGRADRSDERKIGRPQLDDAIPERVGNVDEGAVAGDVGGAEELARPDRVTDLGDEAHGLRARICGPGGAWTAGPWHESAREPDRCQKAENGTTGQRMPHGCVASP